MFSLFVFTATVKNEGRLEAAGGRAGEEFGGQTAAEEPSPELEGRSPEPAKRTRAAGQCDGNNVTCFIGELRFFLFVTALIILHFNRKDISSRPSRCFSAQNELKMQILNK